MAPVNVGLGVGVDTRTGHQIVIESGRIMLRGKLDNGNYAIMRSLSDTTGEIKLSGKVM